MKITQWNGKKIDKPGIYSGLPIEKYHEQICVGLSFSSGNLRRVLECNGGSPRHLFADWSGNPNRLPQKDSRPMAIGRAAHHLLLGEPNFRKYYAIRPNQYDSWRTTAAQDWRARMTEQGYTVLTLDDFANIQGMARALETAQLAPSDDWSKPAMHVYELLTGSIEMSFIWQDKATGLWLKARPDSIPAPTDFADLKTTASVQYQDLLRAVANGGFQQAAANVAEGAFVCGGLRLSTFALIFCESSHPYCVRPVFLKDDDIARGAAMNHEAIQLIARCLKAGHWPGPGGGRTIEHIDLPDWYRSNADFEIGELKRLRELADRDEPKRKAKA